VMADAVGVITVVGCFLLLRAFRLEKKQSKRGN